MIKLIDSVNHRCVELWLPCVNSMRTSKNEENPRERGRQRKKSQKIVRPTVVWWGGCCEFLRNQHHQHACAAIESDMQMLTSESLLSCDYFLFCLPLFFARTIRLKHFGKMRNRQRQRPTRYTAATKKIYTRELLNRIIIALHDAMSENKQWLKHVAGIKLREQITTENNNNKISKKKKRQQRTENAIEDFIIQFACIYSHSRETEEVI